MHTTYHVCVSTTTFVYHLPCLCTTYHVCIPPTMFAYHLLQLRTTYHVCVPPTTFAHHLPRLCTNYHVCAPPTTLANYLLFAYHLPSSGGTLREQCIIHSLLSVCRSLPNSRRAWKRGISQTAGWIKALSNKSPRTLSSSGLTSLLSR